MKNGHVRLLIVLTCIFIGVVAGLLITRMQAPTPVHIQTIPAVPSSADKFTGTGAPAIVNINTADSDQLRTLPGIGSVLADRIIAYRRENGNFSSIGELLLVPGIGEKKLEPIWDLLTTGG